MLSRLHDCFLKYQHIVQDQLSTCAIAVLHTPCNELAVPRQQHRVSGLPCAQLNVASDSPARKYEVGVRYNGELEDDPAFYLFATAGIYQEEDILKLDPESTNWIGFVGIGPLLDGKRDIAIAFRGTEVSEGDKTVAEEGQSCFKLVLKGCSFAWTLCCLMVSVIDYICKAL